jgi:hypothetical protein
MPSSVPVAGSSNSDELVARGIAFLAASSRAGTGISSVQVVDPAGGLGVDVSVLSSGTAQALGPLSDGRSSVMDVLSNTPSRG